VAGPDFDALIVGAGAGGGVAAWVLASQGWKVLLLEKGRNPYPSIGAPELRGSLFGNDEVKLRRYFAFHDPLIEPRLYRSNTTDAFEINELQGLGVCVGGGTVFYDGNSPRVTQADLTLLSTFGAVAGADVVDWPFGYSELAPYYDEVERLVGVQGQAGSDPFAEPRGAYPMPPGYPSKADLVLAKGAKGLGYHPHPMPTAVNSMFYRGRPACTNCGFCAHGCPINAKGSTAVTVIRDALLTGKLTLVTEACVTRIETTPEGDHASGVRFLDHNGVEQTVSATHVILAANAIETPRLLLESANNAHPKGLGNANDLVGTHLMFHVVFNVLGVFASEIRSYRGRIITKAFADFTVKQATPGWVRGGYVELGGQIHPVAFGARLPWPLHKELMVSGELRRRSTSLSMIGEDVPVASNRVELDPKVKDVYGRAAPRITYARHPHDQAMVDWYMPKLRAVVQAAGATQTLDIDMVAEDGVPETKHLLGTTRMGTDPKTSVCDPWGRLHAFDNLHVADGSLWPTSTAYNPVLTQQALAYRTAAHLVDGSDPTSVLPKGPA